MSDVITDLRTRILRHLNDVRRDLRLGPLPADVRFADALDSMGMVELLDRIAADLGVPVEVVERAADRRYDTPEQLARDLAAAGLHPAGRDPGARASRPHESGRVADVPGAPMWLSGAAAVFPERTQGAAELDALLGRPPGWLRRRAGITRRHVWADEDAPAAAARAARQCLEQATLSISDVGVLLVASEAAPHPVGTAAALHHLLGLAPGVPALEIGNACTGFLSALWTAQRLLPHAGAVLVVAVEAPSLRLEVRPGASGEAAALFGDGAAACLLSDRPAGSTPIPLRDVRFLTDGGAGGLLRVRAAAGGAPEIVMHGLPLASWAVGSMVSAVAETAERHGLKVGDLAAVVAHGGNGRMPGLLARALGVAPEVVWSLAADVGNLGSASLPAAWAAHSPAPSGPVVWVAVGAGLQCGAAISGVPC
jgi:3-oxoacyl-[acyl-carrier-protein] synthase-3